MATERVPMQKIREILRLKWVARRSHRDAARSLGVSAGTVAAAVGRARAAALTWDAVEALSDDALERTLYGPTPAEIAGARAEPDLAAIHQELRRPGVTLELLHVEYLAAHPTGYRYSAFCARYRAWRARQRLSMRQVHTAGEKAFVDYAGMRPTIVDAATGEVTAVELFVAVLGASNYTFAEATRTQQSADWIASHVRAVEFFGGVAAVWVPDQLRSGVTRPCRYEPGVQRTYADWAQHYQTVVLPARPAKPRDKAKVEVAVQVAERWILAQLRHETFFSLATLNVRIRELLGALNARPMKGYGGRSRRALFDEFDRPALQPLPAERFVHADWLRARVNIDYHVEVDRHYYSVPHPLVHESSTSASRPRRSRSSSTARASGSMPAAPTRAGTPRSPRTCRRRTAPTRNGARRGSCAGARPSAPRPRRSSSRSSPVARIPSRAIAPVSACCASRNATARPG
jgi:transposase